MPRACNGKGSGKTIESLEVWSSALIPIIRGTIFATRDNFFGRDGQEVGELWEGGQNKAIIPHSKR